LTALTIDKLKPAASRREIPDGGCPGLFLIVQTSGAKSWAIRCRIAGKPTKVTLGPYPRLDLMAAREQARAALALVDRGIDPRQQREAERRDNAERQANTLRAIAEQFRDKHMVRVRKNWRDHWSGLDRYVLARLGDRPIDAIRRRDLHAILDDLADKPGARHHVLSAVGSLFKWAVDREIIENSPAAGLPRPKLGVRQRALSDAELPAVWAVAQSVGYPFGAYVKLLLLTGCRRGELAGLQWSEIDLDDGTITIPAERYKTGLSLLVPLSEPARHVIDELPRLAGGQYVFSTTGGRRPISGFSKMMRRFDSALAKHCEDVGLAAFDFDLHDLRRAVRTGMSALRIPPHVAEACLGHVVTGVQKHYDHWTYRPEKTEALAAWGRKIESLIDPTAPGNVVTLADRR
jgi:integrase